MNLLKTLGITPMILATAISVAPAFAADEHNVGPGLTGVGAPLGLQGVDPVAFIDIGNRIAGSSEFAAVYDGVAYYFSSTKNLLSFEKSPQNYAPQNGGFCTFGVSVGKKFDGNPSYSSVVNGKLYVFLNEGVFKLYQKDQVGTITKAVKQWEKIEHVLATDL